MIRNIDQLTISLRELPFSLVPPKARQWMFQSIDTLADDSVIVEFGTFVGGTTRLIAKRKPTITVHTIDLNNWEVAWILSKQSIGRFTNIHNESDITVSDLATIQDIHLSDLPNVIRHVGDNKTLDVHNIDLAFIDATHNYSSVTSELEYIFTRLKPGGHIFGDDVRHNGVYTATFDFCLKHDLKFTIYNSFFKIQKNY
jgi:predicted O-methyltransferase YrrM